MARQHAEAFRQQLTPAQPMNSPLRLLVFLTLGFLSTAAGYSQTVLFNASLDNLQVPVFDYGGTGSGTLTLDSGTGAWSISGTFNFNSPYHSTDAHIHGPGGAFVNAAIVAPLSFTSGVTAGTFSGSGTFTGPQMADLLAGLYYVNIHSDFYPSGEIRGQLTAVPEPSTYALAAGVMGLAAAGAWRSRRKPAV